MNDADKPLGQVINAVLRRYARKPFTRIHHGCQRLAVSSALSLSQAVNFVKLVHDCG